MAEIKIDEWFKQGYSPVNPDDEEESVHIEDEGFWSHEVV